MKRCSTKLSIWKNLTNDKCYSLTMSENKITVITCNADDIDLIKH